MGVSDEETAKADAKRFLALCEERERRHYRLVMFWRIFGIIIAIAVVYGAWRLLMFH